MSYPRMRLDVSTTVDGQVSGTYRSEGRNFLDQERAVTADALVHTVVRAKKVRPAGEARGHLPGTYRSRGMLPQAVNCITLPKLRVSNRPGHRYIQ